MAASEDVLEVPPTHGPVIRHIIEVLMLESDALQEIISISNTRKDVIQMLSSKDAGRISSQAIVQDAEKDVDTLCEDVICSDESVFLGCFFNIRVYTVFNKHTKFIMRFIEVFINDFQTEAEDVEDDVEEIMDDIVVSPLKKTRKLLVKKRFPQMFLLFP